jgi:hypothetical protein
MHVGESLNPTDRYVLLRDGMPCFTTSRKKDLIPYLWGRIMWSAPHAPARYVVLDYEVPYVVDTGNVDAFVASLPE